MFKRVLRPRVLVYFAALAVLGGGFVWSLANRAPFQVDVLKDRTALARLAEDGAIENLYRVQIGNRTEQVQHVRLHAEGLPGLVSVVSREMTIEPAGILSLPVTLRLPAEQAAAAGRGSHPVRVVVEPIDPAGSVAAPASFYVPG